MCRLRRELKEEACNLAPTQAYRCKPRPRRGSTGQQEAECFLQSPAWYKAASFHWVQRGEKGWRRAMRAVCQQLKGDRVGTERCTSCQNCRRLLSSSTPGWEAGVGLHTAPRRPGGRLLDANDILQTQGAETPTCLQSQ